MRFNKKRLPKTRNELDMFVREHGLIPYGVTEHRGMDIFIAESDLVKDKVPAAEIPLGYWQVAWFVTKPDSHEDMDIGRGIDFDAMHDLDKGWTAEAKREARIQTAIKDAESWIDKSIKTGRLDA